MKSPHPQNTDKQAKFTLTNIFPTLSTCYYFWCKFFYKLSKFRFTAILSFSCLHPGSEMSFTLYSKNQIGIQGFFYLVPFKRKWDDIMKGTPSFAGFWKTRSLTSPRSNVQLQVETVPLITAHLTPSAYTTDTSQRWKCLLLLLYLVTFTLSPLLQQLQFQIRSSSAVQLLWSIFLFVLFFYPANLAQASNFNL